jgi:hypothetical protein
MQQRTRTAFVVLALPLWAACSVLVDPESLPVRCEIEGGDQATDPCQDLGQKCMNNVCVECDADARELCNGRDDDCDGEIDEGHDADHDGFTWCGGGKVEMADCVDTDPKIHPSGTVADGTVSKAPDEECDGKDNDCDSKVDEDHSCASTKNCVETGCPEGQRCDAENGVCFVPREVGSGCTNDSDCKGGVCLHPGAFGLPISLMDNRCATACCSNADCDDDSSCVISDAGARVCLPKNIVGGGSRKAGEGCVRDSECASGLCLRGACQTRCFNDDACPKQECVLSQGSPSERRIFLCADAPGRLQVGEPCALLSCRTGYCGDDFECKGPCARDEDCASNGLCQFTEVRQIGPTSPVSICMRRPSGSGDAEGIEQLCCTNEDCGSNQLCAPNATERPMQWHMSCRGK